MRQCDLRHDISTPCAIRSVGATIAGSEEFIEALIRFRKGQVIDPFETAIDVQKIGLERFLFRLSHENPLIYGIMSLAIATMACRGASAAFRT